MRCPLMKAVEERYVIEIRTEESKLSIPVQWDGLGGDKTIGNLEPFQGQRRLSCLEKIKNKTRT